VPGALASGVCVEQEAAMKALVAHELNRISVEEVTLEPPKAGEVHVRMAATGVCHSDLSAINGTLPNVFPSVLGHEGAGVVLAVGEGVTTCKPGDHVVMSFVPNCGRCFHCVRNEAYLCRATPRGGMMPDGTARLHLGGTPIAAFLSLGNMAEEVVCPAINVVPIPDDIPLEVAALIGCGVTTGVGAAINTAKVRPGSTVAVFGCGGVGIATIQGARIAGAARIVAVDRSQDKLELAKKFGATDIVRAKDPPATPTPDFVLGQDAVEAIMNATNGIGADYAFEVIGHPQMVEAAIAATRRGGTTIAVGVGKLSEKVRINALAFPLMGKTLAGCMFGSANPQVDFPKLLAPDRFNRTRCCSQRPFSPRSGLASAPAIA
jgi:S-(hydroxymethyl)glutathione dehydrogenase/alcohol dehydrogenase